MPQRGLLLLFALQFAAIGCAGEAPITHAEASAAPIVGGDPAVGDELHSTVAIMWNIPPVRYNWVRCSGSLIFRRIVLTAAHCVTSVNEEGELVVDDPSDFVVAAGHLGSADYAEAEFRSVEEVIVHEDFDNFSQMWPLVDPQGLSSVYDIALLVLDEPVTAVRTTPMLPPGLREAALAEGTLSTILGYGQTETGAAGTLYIADTTINAVAETEFSTRVEEGQGDTCFGDSGAPAYVDFNGRRYIVGVTSRGRSDVAADCGEGGIYTLTPAFFQWVLANLEPNDVFACSAAPYSSASGGVAWLLLVVFVWAQRRRRTQSGFSGASSRSA